MKIRRRGASNRYILAWRCLPGLDPPPPIPFSMAFLFPFRIMAVRGRKVREEKRSLARDGFGVASQAVDRTRKHRMRDSILRGIWFLIVIPSSVQLLSAARQEEDDGRAICLSTSGVVGVVIMPTRVE
jgi:hypothetical protein